jgi:hypothetical protein
VNRRNKGAGGSAISAQARENYLGFTRNRPELGRLGSTISPERSPSDLGNVFIENSLMVAEVKAACRGHEYGSEVLCL